MSQPPDLRVADVTTLVKRALYSPSPIRRAEATAALRLAGLPVSPRAIELVAAELAAQEQQEVTAG